MTDRELIRLECLKLSHRADRLPAQVIDFAKSLEDYVREPQDEKTPAKVDRRFGKRKSDNPAEL